MHANAPGQAQSEWHNRLVRSGYFVGAVLLHLVIFLMVATFVIFRAPVPPVDAEFHGLEVKVPPPQPPVPETSGDAAANPQLEPTQVVVPEVTPPSVTTTHFDSNFKVDTTAALNQAMNHLSQAAPTGSGMTQGAGNAGAGAGSSIASVFGSQSSTGNEVTGYFYDLKQTADKKPTNIDLDHYYQVLSEFLRTWDDSKLDSYYKSKTPLYADHIAISTRNSADAPAAFNLQNEVQPGLWAIHYHGKVTPPAGGDYRFLGFADNVICVRIDGTNVLDGGWSPLLEKRSLHDTVPFKFPSFIPAATDVKLPNLKIGPSFHLEAGMAVDLDILIGDDGGGCAFFLLIKSEDKQYEQAADGTPKVPFFQLGSGPAPTFQDNEEHPPYSTTPEPWKSGTK